MNYYYEMSFQQLRDYFQDCKLYKDEEKFISLMRVGSFYGEDIIIHEERVVEKFSEILQCI